MLDSEHEIRNEQRCQKFECPAKYPASNYSELQLSIALCKNQLFRQYKNIAVQFKKLCGPDVSDAGKALKWSEFCNGIAVGGNSPCAYMKES